METETERQTRRKENSAIFLLRVSYTIYERKIRTAQKLHMESYMSGENANIQFMTVILFTFVRFIVIVVVVWPPCSSCHCSVCYAAHIRAERSRERVKERERENIEKHMMPVFAMRLPRACFVYIFVVVRLAWTRRSKFGLSEMCNMILTW